MRIPARLSAFALAAGLLLAGCGSSSNSTTSSSTAQPAAATTQSSSGGTVKTASSSLGTILVAANGMTLYHLGGEQNGKFICANSTCTGIWHPLTVTSGSTPSGEVGSLGTVKRPEGATQVTYKGAPLYTFAQDRQAGEVKGQGIKDVGTWSVITTGSAAASSGTQSTAPESGGSSESGGASEGGGSASGGGYKY
jgi:predicted lipoprotein with Yx(FWY)xxD motif